MTDTDQTTPACSRCRAFEETDNTCRFNPPEHIGFNETTGDRAFSWPPTRPTDWCRKFERVTPVRQ